MRLAALDTVLDVEWPALTPVTFVEALTHAWSRCVVDEQARRTAPSVGALSIKSPADDDEAIRAALQRLSQDVTHRLIAAQTGRLLMFHAGAVSDPATGSTLVFVAPSGTGKTTLARLLGRTYSYLTDETVGIDPATGGVRPYPKPLSVSHGGGWRKVETSPEDLGLLPSHPEPVVSRIVLLNRNEGAPPSVATDELGTLDAIAALVPETSALNRLPRPLHAVAGLLDRAGPLLRLTYRESGDLVPLASQLIEGTP
ncbi:hypothetical protein RPIT_13955 [Tessaracoccus flavus]|uniref:Uncharacterized protein n=1 Tax=Tessaracoccus flavus TaxID=1610493 RepID=A0A1Q2CJ97_9ACTN|nr:hypothetical protein RPIT_13955 [Tessaracoccus flavus]